MQKLFSLPPVSFVVETAELFLKMGASRAAAALSYFLILTLFPLLVCVNYFIGLFHLDLEDLLELHLPRHIAELLPLDALSGLWQWMRYLLLFSFVLLLVLIVYRAGTPRGAMRLPVVLLSSLLAALAIVGASVMFSWFIGMSSRYALVYGSLASLIILLVWLYLCGNLLLLGAVIGRVLEARWRN